MFESVYLITRLTAPLTWLSEALYLETMVYKGLPLLTVVYRAFKLLELTSCYVFFLYLSFNCVSAEVFEEASTCFIHLRDTKSGESGVSSGS